MQIAETDRIAYKYNGSASRVKRAFEKPGMMLVRIA